MKSLMDYPLFNGAVIISVMFIIFLFIPAYMLPGKSLVLLAIGIIGTGFWIAFLIRWNRDKKLIATGEIVNGKIIRDSIRYKTINHGYYISARIAVYNEDANETLLFKDEVFMTYIQASQIGKIPEDVSVRVIYDQKNPKRNIIYLREALEDI